MVSKAALVSKAFGKTGALASIANESLTAENRKIKYESNGIESSSHFKGIW